MKHVATTFIVTVAGLVLFGEFVWRILNIILPVVAAAALLVVVCAALSVSLRLVASGVRSLRPEPVLYDVLPASEPRQTFAKAVEGFYRANEPDEQAQQHIHAEHWRTASLQFFWIGEHYGFGIGDMSPFISRKKRDVYIKLFTTKPSAFLVTGHEGTTWAPGWNFGGCRTALARRLIIPPYPEGEPPYLNFYAAVERAKRTQRTKWSTPDTASTPLGVTVFSPMRDMP